MPIFEYSCNGCGNTFELLVNRHDDTVQCPNCGSSDVEKLFSAFARSCSGCDSSGST